MKTLLFVLGFFFMVGNIVAVAPPDKAKTKAFLMKTNRALGVAHMTVKRTKNYDGTLAKAVRHQRVARKMYMAGNFARAIAHSKRARALAKQVMSNNKAKPNTDFDLSADENANATDAATDAELEAEMAKEEPSELKDEDLMNGNLSIDIQ